MGKSLLAYFPTFASMLIRWRKYFMENRLVTSCFLAHLCISLLLLSFHEPWRDELQCWAIARESTSFADLLFKARYEGHPSAWYAVLYLITRFSDAFLAVRIFHFLLTSATAFLILFKSPFSKIQKCLLIFGYFFMYEYGVLTRNYAVAIFIFLLICFLLKNANKNWWTICGLLFVAMQANVFAAILGVAFFTAFFSRALFQKSGINLYKTVFGILIFLAGLAITALDMLPPADSTFMPEWKWAAPEWRYALSSYYHAMIPVPQPELHFWNTHGLSYLIEWEHLANLELALAIVILAGCLLSLRKHPFAMLFYGIAWLSITIFISVKYVGFMRHHGHYFIAYVMALWLRIDEPQSTRPGNIFFLVLLLFQLFATGLASYFDIKYPFTQSLRAAAYIEQHSPTGQLLVGHWDYAASPVAFHLERPIYYPNQGKKGTFIYWSAERFVREIKDIEAEASTICQDQGPFLLLTNYPLAGSPIPETNIQLLENFAPAVVKDEEYWLYSVTCFP